MTHFKFWGPIHITGMAEGRVVKLCAQVGRLCQVFPTADKSPPKGMWLWSHDPLNIND